MYGGYDAVDAFTGSNLRGKDCNGHGTHCAGIAAGLVSGVAEDANLYSMRIFDCNGNSNTEWILNAMIRIYWKHLENRQK